MTAFFIIFTSDIFEFVFKKYYFEDDPQSRKAIFECIKSEFEDDMFYYLDPYILGTKRLAPPNSYLYRFLTKILPYESNRRKIAYYLFSIIMRKYLNSKNIGE